MSVTLQEQVNNDQIHHAISYCTAFCQNVKQLMGIFKEGQTSFEVCQSIVNAERSVSRLSLVIHAVELNWRQRYRLPASKLAHIEESFEAPGYLSKLELRRRAFLGMRVEDLEARKEANLVWSILSSITTVDGEAMHLPMMNFHPEGIALKEFPRFIRAAVRRIDQGRPGVIVRSGRYFHYYGGYLLNEQEWLKFLGHFLMPTILTSPRYIGHALRNGYASLRLTADNKYKPVVPTVIEVL
jgi:hypothetical protein